MHSLRSHSRAWSALPNLLLRAAWLPHLRSKTPTRLRPERGKRVLTIRARAGQARSTRNAMAARALDEPRVPLSRMSCVHLLAVHPYQRKVATAACGERLTLRHSMWRTVRVAEEEIALIGVAARPWCARCLE